ncbi:MAG TPA: DUF1697 domain-containing protein [Candidatus Saccharimonadales bacterium]|nr:DUF1697 domain-containing protein [Candidatus Saccharimonadales bacterium]
MTKYVAFLRGINVGGNKKVPMSDLKTAFESLGFSNVRTLLNSGNAVFDAEKADKEKIEKKLEKLFGFQISVILRTMDNIKKLVDSKPFDRIKITPLTRLYVTFLKDPPPPRLRRAGKSESKLKTPYESPDKSFKILKVTEGEVISLVTLSPKFNTTEAMKVLEKEFGNKVTTRNWNTIVKLVNL